MTTQTLQSAPMTAAASPRVNLMPPEIAEAARFRQIQVLLGAAVVFAVFVVGLLYYNAHKGVSGAQAKLDAAQQQQTSLQAKLNSLASVQQTLNAVQAKQAMVAQAMGTEVRWSFLLNDLAFRQPGGVWLTSLTVTETATSAASPTATGASTLGAAATPVETVFPIGTVDFVGIAFTHDDVAKWLDAMAKVKGFLNPLFTSSSESSIGARNVVNYQGHTTLTSPLFSHRYTTGGSAVTAPAAPSTTTPSAPADSGPADVGAGAGVGTGIAAP